MVHFALSGDPANHRQRARFPGLGLLCCIALTALFLGLFAQPAWAHNSLASSLPANGETTTVRPNEIALTFTKLVDVATLTVRVSATGRSTKLVPRLGLDERTALATIPEWATGNVSVLWNLVGPDGHVVRGVVGFTVPPQIGNSTTDGSLGDPSLDLLLNDTGPNYLLNDPGPNYASSLKTMSPGWVRGLLDWTLRLVAFGALFAAVGILITTSIVWPEGADHPLLARIVQGSLAAIAAVATMQLVLLITDFGGSSAVSTALGTYAGEGLLARFASLAVLAACLRPSQVVDGADRAILGAVAVVGLLGSFAWAGHSRSVRWPVVGVIADIVHQLAAISWLAGLVIVGRFGLRATGAKRAVLQFSRLAATAVAMLAISGAIQTLRIDGTPAALISGRHGRLTLAKLALVALMIFFGSQNRARVKAIATGSGTGAATRAALQKAMRIEAALGVAVLAITAVLVATAPPLST